MQNFNRNYNKITKAIREVLNFRCHWINFRRCIRKENLVVVIGTAHKVGSTWLYGLLKDLGHFEVGSIWFPRKFMESGTILLEKPRVLEYMTRLRGWWLFKSHSYPVSEKLSNKIRFVSIYRDPRDVIASSIFYLGNIEQEKGGWGPEFTKLSEQERIKTFLRKAEFCISRLERWVRAPAVCQVRYEDMKKQPLKELKRVLQYLGIEEDERTIERAVIKNSFEAKSGRKAGEERKGSFLRKGISGDWKNYFDRDCIDKFKHEMEGRWNQLLVEMGYEKTLDW